MTQNRSEPTFYVLVREEGQSEAQRIDESIEVMSLEYQDEESKADLVKLTVRNYPLLNFDDTTWRPGNVITVAWGYVGNMTKPRDARITKVTGSTELTIEAQGKESDMNKVVRRRSWTNKSRSEVAAEIAKEHGFEGAAQHIEDTEEVEEVISQTGETDAQFLRRLSMIEGLEFYADVDGLHFHRRKLDQKPVKEVRWYLPKREGQTGAVGDIISWDVDTDVYGPPDEKPGRIVIRGRDPGTKQSFTVAASDRETVRDKTAALPTVVSPEEGSETFQKAVAREDVRRTSQTTEAAAKREADGIYRKVSLKSVELGMNLVGDPQIQAKTLIAVSGISKRLAGLYYVKAATHSISSSGYTTAVKLASDGVAGYAQEQSAKSTAFANASAKSKAKVNTNKAESADPGKLAVRYTNNKWTGQPESYYVDADGKEVPNTRTTLAELPPEAAFFGDAWLTGENQVG